MACCPDCGWDNIPDRPYTIGVDGDIILLDIHWDSDHQCVVISNSDIEQYGEQNIYPKIEDENISSDGYEWTEIHFCPNCQSKFSFNDSTI